MRYFRTYPLGLQLLLFTLMTFTMLSLAWVLIGALLPKVYGVPISDILEISEHTKPMLIHLSLIAQGIGSLMFFLTPSLTFAYLTHPSPRKYLGLRAPQKPIHLLIAILVMLGAMPLFMLLQNLMGHIDFGAEVRQKQAASDAVFRAYLTMPAFTDFLRTFIVVAIIPALGEELFFRGIVMRFTHKVTHNIAIPIAFSALIFAFTHASYSGLPSIFLAGVLLAAIYYLTGSIWCGILAHLFFNGSQIFLSYLGNSNNKASELVNENTIQWGLVAGGAVLLVAAFYMLWKTRTPLTNNWSDDYDHPKHHSADEQFAVTNE